MLCNLFVEHCNLDTVFSCFAAAICKAAAPGTEKTAWQPQSSLTVFLPEHDSSLVHLKMFGKLCVLQVTHVQKRCKVYLHMFALASCTTSAFGLTCSKSRASKCLSLFHALSKCCCGSRFWHCLINGNWHMHQAKIKSFVTILILMLSFGEQGIKFP